MSWSTDGQTPEFLAATRMASLGNPIVETILSKLNLTPGMRVLDLGSGSGEYCIRLGSATNGVHYTGVDYDPGFVEFANARVSGNVGYPFELPNPANEYRFICADGCDLPFEDGSFDVVVSHTYLTAVPDWACALAEMCRVCKPNGTVSSITSMTDDFYGTGDIGLFTNLVDPESAQLLGLVEKAKRTAIASIDLTSGVHPRKAPISFEWIGLRDVRCTPLAHYFCLSDARIDADAKARYVDLLRAMETKQMKRLMEHPATRDELSPEQWEAYGRLLDERCATLKALPANREWNWYGNASMLICGTVPSIAPLERWKAFRDAHREANTALASCDSIGISLQESIRQLGPGRCAKATLVLADGRTASAVGFDPPRALLEACSKALDVSENIVMGSAPERLSMLCTSEAANSQAEVHLNATAPDFNLLPDLANDVVYSMPDMWETVSEAAFAGMASTFKDVGSTEGHALVACIMRKNTNEVVKIAAHPDIQEATMRAFSRCVDSLSNTI